MTLLLLFPVPLWVAGVAFLAGLFTIPALVSLVWLHDARVARKRGEG